MNNKVLIIGADHHNTLGLVESLGQKGIKSYVLIVAEVKKSFVLKSKYVNDGWICSKLEEIADEMLKHFSDTQNKTIVYSSYDDVSSVLDASSDRLSPFFILPITNEMGSLRHKMSKEYMSELAREVGLCVPQTWIVSNGIIPSDVEFPCITKAISSVEGTKKNIKICHTKEQLKHFFENSDHCPVIQIQKFISKEYEFQFLGCSLNSGKHVIISGRTHIDRPNGIDNTFFLKFDKVESEYNDVLSKAKDFIRRTGYSGTFSVEFLKDKNNGKYYFTETNFRNDGNAICQTSAGINVPYIYYLYYSGEDWKKELTNSEVHTTYLMPEIYYFKCLLKREFSFYEWWKNYKKTTCFISYFKGDTKPFWGNLFREIKTTLTNKLIIYLMNLIRKIYKELTSVHWEIGFLDNTVEGIVNGEDLKLSLVTHDYPNSWFADPFILDVTDEIIIVLVEEVTKKIQKGRITKLVIDRKTNHVVEKKIILERPGHLSFPIIYRDGEKIYIYPENSEDESLNIYEYSIQDDKLTLIHELSDRPLTDAVFTDLFGKPQLFTTEADYANGFQLDQYEWDSEKKKFIFVTCNTFSEHIARMAGYFFSVNGKVYRPAQESNTNYGHGISLQETSFKNGKWEFKEIRRMVSPHPKLTQSFHTLNSYKGIIVVDVLGKRHPLANRILSFLLAPIRKLKNKR